MDKQDRLRMMKPRIVELLKRNGAKDVSNISLLQAAKRQVSERKLLQQAIEMRDAGILTIEDIKGE